MNRIKAKYWIETDHPLDKAIATMAGEQSTGTFVDIPGLASKNIEKYAAKIESINILREVDTPSLQHGKKMDGPIHQAEVELSWSIGNVGRNLPILLATIAGNLFELAPFSGLRLLDVEFPNVYREYYRGPQFGIDGTYKKIGLKKGKPIIGTIIKPSVGLTPEATAEKVKLLIEGGLDFIKDDELMGSTSNNEFEKRVEACMAVINNFADTTGKKPMYAFNISGTISDMLRRHDYVLEQGGTCIMMNLLWVGFSGIEEIAGHSQLPIHGHRNGWGFFSRSSGIGMSYTAMSKLWRLAGVDHLHTNGIRNKFCETDESVLHSIQSCQKPLWSDEDRAVPVISSGQWAGQVFDTFKAIGNADVMYLCGGGIMGHPDGYKAGIESVRYAWESALGGLTETEARKKFDSVDKAFNFFG